MGDAGLSTGLSTGLSRHEKRALAEIEAALRSDEILDRSLRTMHLTVRHRLWEVIRRPRGMFVAGLAVTCLCLLIAAGATSGATVIWAFAGAWLVTLLIGFSLLQKRTNRSRG
ncbi:DUF3040 domain-containing protein [Streptomyces sp. NPDC006356]